MVEDEITVCRIISISLSYIKLSFIVDNYILSTNSLILFLKEKATHTPKVLFKYSHRSP